MSFKSTLDNIKKGKELFADYQMTDKDNNNAQDNSKDESSDNEDNDNSNKESISESRNSKNKDKWCRRQFLNRLSQ